MGLLSKIFGFKQGENERDNTPSANYPEEYQQILKFNRILELLLITYIAFSMSMNGSCY